MTLKSRLMVIQVHWKRNHWVDHTRLTIRRVASTLWNTMPSEIQSSPSLTLFRQRLKTYLFQRSFPGVLLWWLRLRGPRNNICYSGHVKYISDWLIELLDVEYYRDLETWVRGHSRSLKLVPFESLGAVSHSPFIVTMAVSVAVCEIFSVKE